MLLTFFVCGKSRLNLIKYLPCLYLCVLHVIFCCFCCFFSVLRNSGTRLLWSTSRWSRRSTPPKPHMDTEGSLGWRRTEWIRSLKHDTKPAGWVFFSAVFLFLEISVIVCFWCLGSCGSRLCRSGGATFIPERHGKGIWWEIWCSKGSCGQSEEKRLFLSEKFNITTELPLKYFTVCFGLWVQRRGGAAHLSKRSIPIFDKLLSDIRASHSILLLNFCFLLDYAKGFGGKYGVEKEKVDKASLGYDYKGETEKHQSQKGESRRKLFLSVLPAVYLSFTCRLLKGIWREIWHREGQSG